MSLKNYIDLAKQQILNSLEKSEDNLKVAANILGEVMANDGIIQLFGIGHDISVGMELGFRAGGLVQYHQMRLDDLILRGHIEALKDDKDLYDNKDVAKQLWEIYDIRANDALLIYVVNDVYDITLELAKHAKSLGHKIILLTSENNILASDYTQNAKELLKISDLVVDLNISSPDVFYKVGDYKITQIANLVGNTFAQVLTIEIYNYLKAINKKPAVLWSMNIKGADEHNKTLTEKYDGRWNS